MLVQINLENLMVTKPQNPATPKADKPARKPAPKLTERIKTQLNAAALRGKLSVDDLSDLEQSIKRLATFLGAA